MRYALTVAAALTLAGCSSFSADGGFAPVADAARTHLGAEARWPRSVDERGKRDAVVAALLAQPLSATAAVQVALLNNPGLQAAFEQLGVSEADLVAAGRLQNPRFTFLHAAAGGLSTVEESLTFNLLSLLVTPYAQDAERHAFTQVQDAVIIQVVDLAARTRAAYYRAVAAGDSLRYAWQIKNGAQAGDELAHRMLGAGNWNRVDYARERLFFLEALQALTRAREQDETARVELERLLGLTENMPLTLPDHLDNVPEGLAEPPDQVATALQNRLDLKLERARVDELAQRLKLTRATRIVNVLDVGPARVHEGPRDQPTETGYEISIEVPIFDSGAARLRRSEAVYAQAVDHLAAAALDARAEIRTAASRYRTAFELALRQHGEILRLAKSVSQQDILRYNAAQLSVFDLLADARIRISTVEASIDSVRDYWIAKSALEAALIAPPSSP